MENRGVVSNMVKRFSQFIGEQDSPASPPPSTPQMAREQGHSRGAREPNSGAQMLFDSQGYMVPQNVQGAPPPPAPAPQTNESECLFSIEV